MRYWGKAYGILARSSTDVRSMRLWTLSARIAARKECVTERLTVGGGLAVGTRAARKRMAAIGRYQSWRMASSRGPNQLHRLPAHGLATVDSLSDVVGIATSTEAPAQETIVDVDLLNSHASDFAAAARNGFWILRTDPHIHTLRLTLCRAVHGSMQGHGQIREPRSRHPRLYQRLDRLPARPAPLGHQTGLVQCLSEGPLKVSELALAMYPKSHSMGITSPLSSPARSYGPPRRCHWAPRPRRGLPASLDGVES